MMYPLRALLLMVLQLHLLIQHHYWASHVLFVSKLLRT